MTPDFIPGLELAQLFYREAVQPVMAARFSRLPYSAARLDSGSDVLGFDTPQSMDHGWGPRLTLYVSETDLALGDSIGAVLASELPFEIRGHPTHFRSRELSRSDLLLVDQRPINHGVSVTTPARFFADYIGRDATRPMHETDWLAIPPQRLRTIASGRVFHDGLGQLEPARRVLAWYPRDVWLYLMANQWRRIDQEEPFMARCGDAGDELGSRLVAARLILDLMRLCFLIERQYPPYMKWFGTAFSRLGCASQLAPVFHAVLDSAGWKQREVHLAQAYLAVAEQHNRLAVTPPIEPGVSPFFNRPYRVPHSSRFVEALHAAIVSPAIRALPPHAGAVWQFADSTDVLDEVDRCTAITAAMHA